MHPPIPQQTPTQLQSQQNRQIIALPLAAILSENMTPAIWQELARAIHAEIKGGAKGINVTHGTVIRLLPALNLTDEQIDEGATILTEVLAGLTA
jgi:4-aminobutyrate aminotransferase-like enzyme